MAVTLTGADRTVHLGMAAVSPSDQVSGGVWKLGDTLPSGDDLCLGQLGIGSGFAGQLDLNLISPVGSTGDSSVKMFRRYRDRAGNLLSELVSSAFTVDGTEATHTMALPSAPANTATVEWGLLSNMTPPGAPVRTNLYPDPRCTSYANWTTRNAWQVATNADGSNIGGVTGLNTYVSISVLSGTGGTGTYRGLNWYQAIDGATPTAGLGLPVTAGTTVTLSAWVRSSTRALTMGLSVRFFSGSAWAGAAVAGSTVAVTIGAWTRVSVTATVPVGATHVCGFAGVPGSIGWSTIGEHLDVSGVLVEVAGSVATYFDGTTKNGIAAPSSVRWEDGENDSRSLLYGSAAAGGTTVQATASLLTYSADALEVVGVALERDLRRSVADIWNNESALITAGTPALLNGTLTLLCATLAQALGVDSIYRMGGLVTLDSGDELDGLTHRAVGKSRINPEKVLPGKTPKWTLAVEFREQVA